MSRTWRGYGNRGRRRGGGGVSQAMSIRKHSPTADSAYCTTDDDNLEMSMAQHVAGIGGAACDARGGGTTRGLQRRSYGLTEGVLHVKVLSLAKSMLLILYLLREAQLQLVAYTCTDVISKQKFSCSRSSCAWMYSIFGGIPPFNVPYKESICMSFFVATLIGLVLFIAVLWLRQREEAAASADDSTASGGIYSVLEASSRRRSVVYKLVLVVPYSLLELIFIFGLLYESYRAISYRQDFAWSLIRGICSFILVSLSLILHSLTVSWLFDRPFEDDYYGDEGDDAWDFKPFTTGRGSGRRRPGDVEGRGNKMLLGSGPNTSGRSGGVGGGPANGTPGQIVHLPPGHLYHSALGIGGGGAVTPSGGVTTDGRPTMFYTDHMMNESEGSADSSVGYGRLRQALRAQAAANRNGAQLNLHHISPAGGRHLVQGNCEGAVNGGLMVTPMGTGGGGGAGHRGGDSASLAATLGAGGPHAMLSPVASHPNFGLYVDEATDYSQQVQSLRAAALLRGEGGGGRNVSHHCSPMLHRSGAVDGNGVVTGGGVTGRQGSQQSIGTAKTSANVSVSTTGQGVVAGGGGGRDPRAPETNGDGRPESAYLEVI